MTIRTLDQCQLSYVLLPYKRDQDVVKIVPCKGDLCYIVSVVDGWNHPDFIKRDIPGRKVSNFVADLFPKIFLGINAGDLKERAEKAAAVVDKEVLAKYPAHVACVAVFVFFYLTQTIIVSVGTINTYIWENARWKKPKEIGNYFLPVPPYASGSRTFFGRGELKNDPFYALHTDLAIYSSETPVLIATDGLDIVLTIDDINKITQALEQKTPKAIIAALVCEIKKRKKQKDDISILLRISQSVLI